MKPERPIETARLLLRAQLGTDRDFIVSLWCDEENGAFMNTPVFADLDDEYLSFFDEMENDPDGYYLIAERKATGEPVGTFCVFPEEDSWDVGYCIDKKRWREGLGSEMLGGLIEFIKTSGGSAVTAEVADCNAASVGMLTKFGFAPTRATRFKKWGGDTVFDAHVFRLDL